MRMMSHTTLHPHHDNCHTWQLSHMSYTHHDNCHTVVTMSTVTQLTHTCIYSRHVCVNCVTVLIVTTVWQLCLIRHVCLIRHLILKTCVSYKTYSSFMPLYSSDEYKGFHTHLQCVLQCDAVCVAVRCIVCCSAMHCVLQCDVTLPHGIHTYPTSHF